MNFRQESRKFAEVLRVEHEALGELLDGLRKRQLSEDIEPLVASASEAWDAVRFQRARVEAAHGTQTQAQAAQK